jgi:hypothetical protein
LTVLLWVTAPAITVAAAETYVGTVTVTGGTRPASAQLTVTIQEYTSDERAFALAETLHKDGHAAAVAEMVKTEVGTVRLGQGAGLRATLVRQEKTATGRIVRVITERPLQVGDARPAATVPADAVGYVELQLDAAGVGSGRLLTAVKAMFDAEGFVVPESLGETWSLSDVKPGP